MRSTFTLLLAFLVSFYALGQTDGIPIGKTVPTFTLAGNGGLSVSLADLAGNKAVVVVFTNDLCPNSRLYGKRLQDLTKAYASQGVIFLLVMPGINMENGGSQVINLAGQVPPVTGETTTQSAAVFTDKDQVLSRLLGATKTPEAFVLQPQSGNFVLRYKGAIDDNPQLETAVKESYLRNALEAILAGRSPRVAEKRAFGCMIRKY